MTTNIQMLLDKLEPILPKAVKQLRYALKVGDSSLRRTVEQQVHAFAERHFYLRGVNPNHPFAVPECE